MSAEDPGVDKLLIANMDNGIYIGQFAASPRLSTATAASPVWAEGYGIWIQTLTARIDHRYVALQKRIPFSRTIYMGQFKKNKCDGSGVFQTINSRIDYNFIEATGIQDKTAGQVYVEQQVYAGKYMIDEMHGRGVMWERGRNQYAKGEPSNYEMVISGNWKKGVCIERRDMHQYEAYPKEREIQAPPGFTAKDLDRGDVTTVMEAWRCAQEVERLLSKVGEVNSYRNMDDSPLAMWNGLYSKEGEILAYVDLKDSGDYNYLREIQLEEEEEEEERSIYIGSLFETLLRDVKEISTTAISPGGLIKRLITFYSQEPELEPEPEPELEPEPETPESTGGAARVKQTRTRRKGAKRKGTKRKGTKRKGTKRKGTKRKGTKRKGARRKGARRKGSKKKKTKRRTN